LLSGILGRVGFLPIFSKVKDSEYQEAASAHRMKVAAADKAGKEVLDLEDFHQMRSWKET